MNFADLGLSDLLVRAVAEEGYEKPTPIQIKAIPHVLAGTDLLGLAQTGTGKTAAFALPILDRLMANKTAETRGKRPVRVLVLTPTRELASQVSESFSTYGRHTKFKVAVVFGGVGIEPQRRVLREGVDILVATPGRLLDLAQQGAVQLDKLEVFVLDEADRMLDMGFIHDVKRIIRLVPPRGKRQTLFFSATMPPDAKELADALLEKPAEVAVAPVSATADRIEQTLYYVERTEKRDLLIDLLKDKSLSRVIVFSRMKHAANRVAESLLDAGISAAAIHGNKSQSARERALLGFREGTVRVLVATDIAARGIDVDNISHVINVDLPEVPETYVHRIGRTARAGSSGLAISFCDIDEREMLRDIQRLIGKEIPVVEDHKYASKIPLSREPYKSPGKSSGGGGGGRPQQRGGGGGGGGRGQGGSRPQGGGGPRPQSAGRPAASAGGRPSGGQAPRAGAGTDGPRPANTRDWSTPRPRREPGSAVGARNPRPEGAGRPDGRSPSRGPASASRGSGGPRRGPSSR